MRFALLQSRQRSVCAATRHVLSLRRSVDLDRPAARGVHCRPLASVGAIRNVHWDFPLKNQIREPKTRCADRRRLCSRQRFPARNRCLQATREAVALQALAHRASMPVPAATAPPVRPALRAQTSTTTSTMTSTNSIGNAPHGTPLLDSAATATAAASGAGAGSGIADGQGAAATAVAIPFEIEHQDVHLELFFDRQLVCGRATLLVRPRAANLAQVVLNLRAARIARVCVAGRQVDGYTYRDPIALATATLRGRPHHHHHHHHHHSTHHTPHSRPRTSQTRASLAASGVKLHIQRPHPADLASRRSSPLVAPDLPPLLLDDDTAASRAAHDAKYFSHFRNTYSRALQASDDGELVIPIDRSLIRPIVTPPPPPPSIVGAVPATITIPAPTQATQTHNTTADPTNEGVAGASAASIHMFEPISIEITYSIQNPESGCQFILPTSIEREHLYPQFSTRNQHSFARYWVPCVDQPFKRCTWNISVSYAATLGRTLPSAFGLVEKGGLSPVLAEALNILALSKPAVTLPDGSHANDDPPLSATPFTPLPRSTSVSGAFVDSNDNSVSGISRRGSLRKLSSGDSLISEQGHVPTLKLTLGGGIKRSESATDSTTLRDTRTNNVGEQPQLDVKPPAVKLTLKPSKLLKIKRPATDDPVDTKIVDQGTPSQASVGEPAVKRTKITLSLAKVKSSSSSSISSLNSDTEYHESNNTNAPEPLVEVAVKTEQSPLKEIEPIDANSVEKPISAIKQAETTHVNGNIAQASTDSIVPTNPMSGSSIDTLLFKSDPSQISRGDTNVDQLVMDEDLANRTDAETLEALRKEIRRPLVALCNGEIKHSFTDKRYQRSTTTFTVDIPTSAQSLAIVVAPFERVAIPSWSASSQAFIKVGEQKARRENEIDDDGVEDENELKANNNNGADKDVIKEHKITNVGGAFAYCLPGKLHMLEYTVSPMSQALGFVEQYLDFDYPHKSFKLIFLDETHNLISTNSSMVICASHLLVDPQIIDQTPETLRVLVKGVVEQWLGGYLPVRSGADNWLLIGLINFITSLFFRKYLGKNEYKWRLKRDMRRVCEIDVNQPPLYPLNPNDPTKLSDSILAQINGVPVGVNQPHPTISIINPTIQPSIPISDTHGIVTDSSSKIENLDANQGPLPKVVISAVKPKQNALPNPLIAMGVLPTPELIQHFHPDDDEFSLTSELICLKAPIVIYMLSRRLGKGHLQKLLNQILTKYKEGALAHGLSTRNFLRLGRYISGNEQQLLDFADQWIYGSGCPKIKVTYNFNRKKMTVEFEITQQNTNNGNNANMKFTGPFTIRIHEPGGMYDNEVHIDDHVSHFEVPYHTKKKVQKSHATSGAASLDWGEEEAERTAFDWISVDPDCHWLCDKVFEQSDFMWALQLEQDRDIFAQCEAAHALKSLPSENTCVVLRNCLMDTSLFYGVRIDAAVALSKCVSELRKGSAMKYLLEPFEKQYCIPSQTLQITTTTRTVFPEGVNVFSKDAEGVATVTTTIYTEAVKHSIAKLDEHVTTTTTTTTEISATEAIQNVIEALNIKKNATQHRGIDDPSDVTHVKRTAEARFFYVKPSDFTDIQEYYVRRATVKAIAAVRDVNLKEQRPCVELLLRLLRFNDNSDNFYSDNYYLAGLITGLGDSFIKRAISHNYDTMDLFPREPWGTGRMDDIMLTYTVFLRGRIQFEQQQMIKATLTSNRNIDPNEVARDMEIDEFDLVDSDEERASEARRGDGDSVPPTPLDDGAYGLDYGEEYGTRSEANDLDKLNVDPEMRIRNLPTSRLLHECLSEIDRYLSLDEIITSYHNTITCACLTVHLKWMLHKFIPTNCHIFLRYTRPGNFFKVRQVALESLLLLGGLTIPDVAEYVLFLLEEDECSRFRYSVAESLNRYFRLLHSQHLVLLQEERMGRRKLGLTRSDGRPTTLKDGTPFECLAKSDFGEGGRLRIALNRVSDVRVRSNVLSAFQLLRHRR